MKILITGISGRIGANLAKALIDAGHEVRGLIWPNDRRLNKLADLPLELVEGSLVDVTDVNRAVAGVDAVCHLGAAFQGGGPFTNEEYFEINVRGTFNMLEAARQNSGRLQQFFFASSDALYEKYIPGGVPEPIREDEFPLRPQGSYALTKLLGEEMCLGYARNDTLPITVFRFALTMAGDEILSFPQFYLQYWLSVYSKMTGGRAAETLQTLQRYADEKGPNCLVIARDENGRSYKKHVADVRDIVTGFLSALGKPTALGQVFQLAAPVPFTWEEAAFDLAGKLQLPYVNVRLPDHVPTFYEFDLAKSRRLIDYRPSYNVRRMIESALDFRAGQAADFIPTNV